MPNHLEILSLVNMDNYIKCGYAAFHTLNYYKRKKIHGKKINKKNRKRKKKFVNDEVSVECNKFYWC